MKNENLGFKKEHNLVIDFHYDNHIINHIEMVKSELTRIPGVQYVSVSSAIPGRPNKKFPTTIEGLNNEKKEFQSDAYFVDYNFLKQYGIGVIAGRGFSKNFAGDFKESMVINEAAVKQLGFSNAREAIGKHFWQRGGTGLIIGVVKDFHFHSLHEEIQPLTMQVTPGFFTFITLSISSENLPQTINKLEKKWSALVPGLPMIYSFMDETFNGQYIAEARFEKLFICFASLAILISCLGLLGLSSFNTTLRTKEIGIRKVLGVSSAGIVQLLTKEFFRLVIIAFFIASPIAWILMNHWLNDFPYRINISLLYFVMAGLIALLIAFATISFQVIKAAMANPVDSLRSE